MNVKMLVIALPLALGACGNTIGERALTGGGIGAGVGALVGAMSGGISILGGAVIGGAVGAGVGAATVLVNK